MRLESIIVNSQDKARGIVERLHRAKRGGYYESFIDDKLRASFVVIYNTRGRGLNNINLKERRGKDGCVEV